MQHRPVVVEHRQQHGALVAVAVLGWKRRPFVHAVTLRSPSDTVPRLRSLPGAVPSVCRPLADAVPSVRHPYPARCCRCAGPYPAQK